MTTPASNFRWFHATPGRLVLALLAVESLLWLSDRLGWPTWHKGYAVLIAVASVAVAMLLMLGWFAASLAFRWRFQFGIRSLLVLVVALALPCSWLTVEMRRAEKQKEAVRAIQKLGGQVGYDYDYDHWKAHELELGFKEQPVPPGPQWLRQVAGDDFVDSVVSVWLQRYSMSIPGGLLDHPVTDNEFEILRAFPRLREVSLDFQPVTDSGVRTLLAFRQVRSIGLYGTRVTDDGLVSLKGLPELERIDIGDTPASFQGIVAIHKDLPSLKVVCIGASQLEAAAGWNHAKEMLPEVQIIRITQKPGGPFSSESQ